MALTPKEASQLGQKSSRKGIQGKKNLQWDIFAQWCLEGGLEKFQKEMNKLKGKDFINAYTQLLEYHKPKQARIEHTGEDGGKIQVEITKTIIEKK